MCSKSRQKCFLKTYILHMPYYEITAVLKTIHKIMKKMLKLISRGLFSKGILGVLVFTILSGPQGLRPSLNLSVPWFYCCQSIRPSVFSVAQTINFSLL